MSNRASAVEGKTEKKESPQVRDWVKGLKPFTGSEDLDPAKVSEDGTIVAGAPSYEVVRSSAKRADLIAVRNGGKGIKRSMARSILVNDPKGRALLKELKSQGIPGA